MIWIVYEENDYEPDVVYGYFTTEEKARAWAKWTGANYLEIKAAEVDRDDDEVVGGRNLFHVELGPRRGVKRVNIVNGKWSRLYNHPHWPFAEHRFFFEWDTFHYLASVATKEEAIAMARAKRKELLETGVSGRERPTLTGDMTSNTW